MSEALPVASLPGSEVTLTVPFFDADMLGIVWHGHYVKYFEVARCALLDRIGYDYLTMKATGYVWPVVDLQIRYLAPARFGQTLKVSAVLKEYEYRMKIGYEIRAAETGDRLARGSTVQVAVSADDGAMCFGSPRVFLDKLETFVAAQE
ncbi:MAG: acyl-CoA thioesterase [Methylohalobius sp. ZOD2]